MRNRRILAVLAAAITAAVVASFLIPAAVGASPKARATTAVCTATGAKPLGNTGVVNVSVKGKGRNADGTPVSCSGKLTGKWAKNSTKFAVQGTGQATVRKAGGYTLQPVLGGLDSVLTNIKLPGTLTGAGQPVGASLTISINCQISYPPLKIRCTIIISD